MVQAHNVGWTPHTIAEVLPKKELKLHVRLLSLGVLHQEEAPPPRSFGFEGQCGFLSENPEGCGK